MFEEFSVGMVTLSDPRDTTLVTFEFEQMCREVHTDVRSEFVHRIELGVIMSVLEMQSQSGPALRWSEVCATEHRVSMSMSMSMSGRSRPRADLGAVPDTRPGGRRRPAATRPVAPGRRVLVRPASAGQVRACHVQEPTASPVVDDVPTWVLVACGVAFGFIMLLALALLGGPAYA